MANWKKVIVSGSDASLHHITASGDVSASGKLFGNLPDDSNIDKVVVYNSDTGQLEWKVLNLVSTVPAPGLFLADFPTKSSTHFKLGFDRGSVTQPITAPFRVSASLDGGSTYAKVSLNDNDLNINGEWSNIDITDQAYYTGGGTTLNITSSITDRRNGLDTNAIGGYNSQSKTLHLQSVLNTNTAVPEYDTIYSPNINYGNRGINNGGIGKLEIYVNDNTTPKRIIDLTDYNAITTTVTGITANLFATASNKNTVGEVDITKHYRSGSITIDDTSTHQNDGYNYAYVIHTGSVDSTQFTHITNFTEWFYDLEGNNEAMVATAGTTELPTLNSSDTHHVSGIKFFTRTSADDSIYRRLAHCTNQYKNIYNPTNGISITMDPALIDQLTVTQSGAHLSTNPTKTIEGNTLSNESVTLAALADTDQSYTGTTQITASFGVTFNINNSFHQPSDFIQSPWGALNSTFDLPNIIQFFNPNKYFKFATFSAIEDFMVNTLTSASGQSADAVYEDFKGEIKRIQDISYSVNDNPSSTGAWDITKNIITGGAGYNGSLTQYYSHLVYPTKAGPSAAGGDFPTGASLGPTSNVDYSGASGERSYLRYYKVNSGQSGNKSINLEFKGSGIIVSSSNTLTTNSNEMHVYFQRLGDGSTSITNSNLTTLIDVINPLVRVGSTFANDSHNIPLTDNVSNIDYGGSDVGSPTISVPTSVVAFSEGAGANLGAIQNEYVIVKIVVPQGWTGYIDAMAIRYGGFTDSTTPLLQSLSPY